MKVVAIIVTVFAVAAAKPVYNGASAGPSSGQQLAVAVHENALGAKLKETCKLVEKTIKAIPEYPVLLSRYVREEINATEIIAAAIPEIAHRPDILSVAVNYALKFADNIIPICKDMSLAHAMYEELKIALSRFLDFEEFNQLEIY